MSAAAVAIPPKTRVDEIPLEQLVDSPANPRKTFNEASLEELAASIRAKGVLSPVMVRPSKEGDLYELIYGHRRTRAARLAGIPTIPAIIVTADDKQALELAVLENCQREDVPPLEEADGYRQLMKAHGYAAEDIAAKVGKSKSWVLARLKLADLGKEVRAALEKGAITPWVAVDIARMPAPLHPAIVKRLTTGRTWDEGGRNDKEETEPLSVRQARRILRAEFMLELGSAPFDVTDAELRPKAGACTTCPKRSGSQSDLFGDVGADVCLDDACFADKKKAHGERIAREAEARGMRVLSAGEVKKVLPYEDHVAYDAPFAKLDDKCEQDPKRRTYRKLLGADAPVVIAKKPDGQVVELVEKKAAAAALKDAGVEIEKRPIYAHTEADRKHREKLKTKRALGALARELVAGVGEKREPTRKDWLAFARVLGDSAGQPGAAAFTRRELPQPTWRSDAAFVKALEAMPVDKLRGFVFELIFGDVWGALAFGSGELSASEKGALELLGLDITKLLKRVADEQAAAKKAEKATSKKPAKKKPRGPAAALAKKKPAAKKKGGRRG